MHQHPLLWAHVQRGIVYNIGDNMESQIENSNILPTKSTKEIAINTSHSSSPSDQNSLHEAVWPNSPSPYPGETTEKYQTQQEPAQIEERRTIRTSEEVLHIGKLSITKDSEASENEITEPMNTKAEETKTLESNQQSFFRMEEMEDQVPIKQQIEVEDYATSLRIEANHQVHQQESQMKIQSHENQPTVVQKSWQTKPSDSVPVARSPEQIEKENFEWNQNGQQETITIKETKDFKPFQLDSESDCPEDPISGPLSVGKTADGDDSDSFWS